MFFKKLILFSWKKFTKKARKTNNINGIKIVKSEKKRILKKKLVFTKKRKKL